MTDPKIKNPPSSLEQIRDVVDETPKGPAVEIGARLRLSATNGDMEHPFTLETIAQGGEKKYEIDAWLKLQIEAGKILVVND